MPSEVCLAHAIEFWTGLTTYVRNRSAESQTAEPPVADALPNMFGARPPTKASPRSMPMSHDDPMHAAS